MNTQEAKQYLNAFINHELNPHDGGRLIFKLDRVNRLLAELNYPQQKFISLHVAGTKGKGSTCAFLTSILQAAGFSVGLYTSPHLMRYQERIRILKPDMVATSSDPFTGEISDETLAQALNAIEPVAKEIKKDKDLGRLSFFEIMTVAALYTFHKSQVDFVVLETGLGGRLDATNVVDARFCGLTSIGLEHTQFLGETIAEIAVEKAGIIKNKFQTAVVAPQLPEAEAVIYEHLRKLKVKSFWLGKDIFWEEGAQDIHGQNFSIKTAQNRYDLRTQMKGRYQILNAGVAVGMIEAMQRVGYLISPEAIAQGIEQAYWPGRFEILQERPLVILDGAHNPSSARALTETVKSFLNGRKIFLIAGFSDDKDHEGIASEFNQFASQVVFTKAAHPRAVDLTNEDLIKLFPGKKIVKEDSVGAALKTVFKEAQPEDAVVVAGSLFVVGEARELCTS